MTRFVVCGTADAGSGRNQNQPFTVLGGQHEEGETNYRSLPLESSRDRFAKTGPGLTDLHRNGIFDGRGQAAVSKRSLPRCPSTVKRFRERKGNEGTTKAARQARILLRIQALAHW